MLVKDIMTRNVISITSNTSVGDALKLMKERKFRRLPVVDGGQLVGLVTQDRLETLKPKNESPLLWQIGYLFSHTTVSDVMRKGTITVKPTDSVEQALATAQKNNVGTLLVIDEGQVVGICTTNDFFYNIVNPTLGLGEPGTRILVSGENLGLLAEKIIACVNKLGIEIKVLWAIPAIHGKSKGIVLHLDTGNGDKVVKELKQLGCIAEIIVR